MSAARRWRVVEFSPLFGYITLEHCWTRPGAALAARSWQARGHNATHMTHAEQDRRNARHEAVWTAMNHEEQGDVIDLEQELIRRRRQP